MRIGYAKLGRSFDINPAKASTAGGDIDVIRLLQRLSHQNPEHEFVIFGRNAGGDLSQLGYPPNVRNLWDKPELRALRVGSMEELTEPFFQAAWDDVKNLDHMIVWAGQHGSTNSYGIPPIAGGESTQPQISALKYSAYILRTINRWREEKPLEREEIWLCPDPRNYLKCRDMAWPLKKPVLAQYDMAREMKHERYGNPNPPDEYGFQDIAVRDPDSMTRWISKMSYTYSAIELTALRAPQQGPEPWANKAERQPFGILSNENRSYVANSRRQILKDWVLSWTTPEVFGAWSSEACLDLGFSPSTIPVSSVYAAMRRWRSTFTMPASGSGWATAKPWEAFRSGTICFFHPAYDTQLHIYGGLHPNTRDFLLVRSPEQLKERVEAVAQNDVLYEEIANDCYTYFVTQFNRYRGGSKLIEERMGLS